MVTLSWERSGQARGRKHSEELKGLSTFKSNSIQSVKAVDLKLRNQFLRKVDAAAGAVADDSPLVALSTIAANPKP